MSMAGTHDPARTNTWYPFDRLRSTQLVSPSTLSALCRLTAAVRSSTSMSEQPQLTSAWTPYSPASCWMRG